MAHFNSALSLRLQIRDRLRDLLEADSLVQTVYTEPIRSLAPESVSATESLVVSLELSRVPRMALAAGPATSGQGSYFNNPGFLLIVQGYAGTDYNDSQEAAYDTVANATDVISQALFRYASDPGIPGYASLWENLTFESPATIPDKLPTKFYYTVTRFFVESYQRLS